MLEIDGLAGHRSLLYVITGSRFRTKVEAQVEISFTRTTILFSYFNISRFLAYFNLTLRSFLNIFPTNA